MAENIEVKDYNFTVCVDTVCVDEAGDSFYAAD